MFMVPGATVTLCTATAVAMAVPGDALAFVLGTSARDVLREGSPAMVVGGVCPADEGPEDVGAARELEVIPSVVPSLVVAVLVFVPWVVISAVTLVEFRVAAQVPVVNVTGAGGTVGFLLVDELSALATVSLGML